ncbi:MAG: ParB/RepB/Spo0J family partition protein [Thermoproteota archaeon]
MTINLRSLPENLPGIMDEIEMSCIKSADNQVRSDNDPVAVQELAKSIMQWGLLQPIIIRLKENNTYEIVAGHRRYRACKTLQWRKIPCHIVHLEDKDAYELSLIENIQRQSLSPLEEAEAFKKYALNFGWGGINELSSKIGKSPSYIAKRIKILDLQPEILESIRNRDIPISTAEEILSVQDRAGQSEIARLISYRRLSLRKTREMIREYNGCSYYDDGSGSGSGDSDHIFSYFKNKETELAKVQRIFDKSIIALRMAMNTLNAAIEKNEENWILSHLLLDHKNILHSQIDALLREKMKYQHIQEIS